MDLTTHLSVGAPLDDVWTAFTHWERLAPCFPGATLEATGPDGFAGSLRVKIGPLALVYTGEGRYVERDEGEHRVVVEARGDDARGHGTAQARTTVRLTASAGEDEDARTEVEVVTELTLTGRPVQFGPAVVSDTSERLMTDFAACLARSFAAGTLPGGSEHAEEDVPDQDVTDQDVGEAGTAPEEAEDEAVPPPSAPAPGPSIPTVAPAYVSAREVGREPRIYEYRPYGDESMPDFEVVANVTTYVVRRWGRWLGAGAALAVLTAEVARRARR